MKKILVACACAAGMLLMLSSSCDDDDFTGPSGKGNQGSMGCSGNPVQEFNFVCNTSGGTLTGNCDGSGLPIVWQSNNDYCNTSSSLCFNSPGACFQVSDGIVTISFGMDPFRGLSIQFLVDEADVKAASGADLDVGTAVVTGTSVVFKAQKTGRCIKLYDSSLCFIPNANVINTFAVTAWADAGTIGTLDTGDTISITWNEARAHEVEDAGQCDSNGAIISCGTTTLIPFS